MVWKFGKMYWELIDDVGERYYLAEAPGGALQLGIDPETQRAVPLNAVQEYTQKTSKKIMTDLRVFRKEFREYARIYWDLLPETDLEAVREARRWRPPRHLPKHLAGLRDQELKHELLLWIKQNAWKQVESSPGLPRKYESFTSADDRHRLIEDALGKYTRILYKARSCEHDLVPVPLGTPCPKPRY